MAVPRPIQPIFEPVHRLAPCRLGVSFGDENPQATSLTPDVLERIVNRIATNALARKVGFRSVTALDQHVWNELVQKSPALQSQDPTRYFTRLAAGSPQLRRGGKRGPPLRALNRRLKLLGDDAAELWNCTQWVFHELIHPQPPGSERLAFNSVKLPDGGNPVTCYRLTGITSMDLQGQRIGKELQDGDLVAAVTALWWSLRESVGKRDLRRYALLYGLWLEARDVIERSPLFRRAADLLYAHTALWFGQVRIRLDPYASPLESPNEFFTATRKELASLWDEQYVVAPPSGLWDLFRLRTEFLKQPLEVRPRSDVAAFMTPEPVQVAQPNVPDRLLANPLPAAPTRGQLHDFEWTMGEFFKPPALPERRDVPVI